MSDVTVLLNRIAIQKKWFSPFWEQERVRESALLSSCKCTMILCPYVYQKCHRIVQVRMRSEKCKLKRVYGLSRGKNARAKPVKMPFSGDIRSKQILLHFRRFGLNSLTFFRRTFNEQLLWKRDEIPTRKWDKVLYECSCVYVDSIPSTPWSVSIVSLMTFH